MPPPPPAASSLPGNLQVGGPYGPEPFGNEVYGGTIQYDDNLFVAFTHHIPGPGSSFREGLESGGWMAGGDGRAAARVNGGGGYSADSDGDDDGGVDFDAQEEEFPRGPASPSLHLFSSRPNTVPSELVSDLARESRGVSRSLSHSHSFTHSPSGRRSSRLGLGLTLSRGAPADVVGSLERSSLLVTPPLAVPPAGPAMACSPRNSRGGARGPPAGSGTLDTDVGRDSVLLASVRMDAVDDWMDSLKQRQQRLSRDGGSVVGGGAASGGQSCSGSVALVASPRSAAAAVPEEECVLAPSLSVSPREFSGLPAAPAAALRVSVANMPLAGDEEVGTPRMIKAEPTMSLSASFEDTLSVFMVEQGMATNASTQKAEGTNSDFTAYANPVFNRPYTLDMSFQ
jgi:hypothetical protein